MDVGFEQLYVFGDSLSDVNNFFNITGGAFPNLPFYAPGRFSNGQVWIEYFADRLGLNPTPFTAIDPTQPTIPAGGLNFAIGGASSDSENVGLGTGFGLEQEIAAFTGFLGGQAANPDALYTLWAGANDYLDLTDFPDKTKEIKAIARETVDNLSDALGTLASVGARHILVFNLPDLGQSPLANDRDPAVAESLTDLTQEHNKLLGKELKKLGKEFSEVNFISVDVNSLFDSFLTNPQAFGLTNVTEGCTNTDIYDPTVPIDPSNFTICGNPAAYLFWDSVHPTTTIHQLIAEFTLDVLELEGGEIAADSNLLLSSFDTTTSDSFVPSTGAIAMDSPSSQSAIDPFSEGTLSPFLLPLIPEASVELDRTDAIAWEAPLDESISALAPISN